MKLLEFSGWRVVMQTQGARLLINAGDRVCSDADVVVITPMGRHEVGRNTLGKSGAWATTGADWQATGRGGIALSPGAPASCGDWEFTWHAGRPGLLVGRSPTASFMFVDGVPHRDVAVVYEPVDWVLIPGDTGKWLSVALGRSYGFERAQHESRLAGIARILDAARSPWVLGEQQEGLATRMAHVAADVTPLRYFHDIQSYVQDTPAANLTARRHVRLVVAGMPFEPELAGEGYPSALEATEDEFEAAAEVLRSMAVDGELAAIAAHWNACLQATLVHARGERKLWRDFAAGARVRSGEGPNELANLFVRCTPRAVLDMCTGSRGVLAVMKDGSLSCWTKLWRIDELGRFRCPAADDGIPQIDSLEPENLLWHLLASLGARPEPE
jgi:hypothetical protein